MVNHRRPVKKTSERTTSTTHTCNHILTILTSTSNTANGSIRFASSGNAGNNLGINKAIARNGTSGVNAAIPLVGDIVIMRLGGPDGRSLISMRGRDAAMVDYVFESPAFRARLAAFQGPARRRLPNWLVVRRARAFPK
ncbi:hypothetical protein DFH07DRAFT_958237 [Mycena maculata]|uniref:Uncharacterized protein n=1 Tax=Mycena maculata TaxID=230809 RepID=A0AAD7NGE9_9AGAR|nr:hypothetical protein DFH07DRAFT_964360 [Mycena maculata]KAJ7758838.1 hypothetical protein DFH07DRAFT_958237 [Mycena maculata]